LFKTRVKLLFVSEMSIIDDINKHQPAWEGETADETKKKIFVIVGNISDEEESSSENNISDEDSE
jgi:hypothetical protein